jgi:hypothetical protein
LWAYVWAAIMKRPLMGYGYDAFWAGLGEALQVRMGIGWMAQRSDNGYLDFALGLGGIGVALLLCLWASRSEGRWRTCNSSSGHLLYGQSRTWRFTRCITFLRAP